MPSRITGLRLRPEGLNLRLINARTGERLLWIAEEATARRRLEKELADLRAELERNQTDG